MKKILYLITLLMPALLFAQTDCGKRLANAEKGIPNDQYMLALQYKYGGKCVDKKDYETALIWYKRAAKNGHTGAMCELGDYYLGIKDYKQAVYWYKWAVDHSEVGSHPIIRLGECYEFGYGVEQNPIIAAIYYMAAAGDSTSSLLQDSLWKQHSLPYIIAVRLRGSPSAEAEYHLGRCYFYGIGINKNQQKAIYWLNRAISSADVFDDDTRQKAKALLDEIEKGKSTTTTSTVDVATLRNQAEAYFNGDGVERDIEKAIDLWRMAASQGDAISQYILGDLYMNGTGIPRSWGQARLWFTEAAKQGHASAAARLAYLFAKGVNGRQNFSQAAEWIREAEKNLDQVDPASRTYLDKAKNAVASSTSIQSTTQAPSSTATTNPSSPATTTTATASSSTATYTRPATASTSKYSRWPYYYNKPVVGLSAGYTQRAISGKEIATGERDHYNMFGFEGWGHGAQIGLLFDAAFDETLWGITTGLYLDVLFDHWEEAPTVYYNSSYDLMLHIPIEYTYSIPFSRHTGLQVRGGLGVDVGLYNELYDTRTAYDADHTEYGTQGYMNRFNLSLDLGINLHLNHILLHATYRHGLSRHPIDEAYHCTLHMLSIGATYIFDD